MEPGRRGGQEPSASLRKVPADGVVPVDGVMPVDGVVMVAPCYGR